MSILITLPSGMPVGSKIIIKNTQEEKIHITSPKTMIYAIVKPDDSTTEIIAVKNKNKRKRGKVTDET
jgi:hypothetical protein